MNNLVKTYSIKYVNTINNSVSSLEVVAENKDSAIKQFSNIFSCHIRIIEARLIPVLNYHNKPNSFKSKYRKGVF